MKRALTAALALSLLSGTAVMAQPNNQGRGDQNRSDQNAKDGDQNDNQKGNAKGKGKAAAKDAAPAAQADRKGPAPDAPKDQTAGRGNAPGAPNDQAARDRGAAAAQAAAAARDRDAAAARDAATARDRDAAAARNTQAARDQAARNRPAPPSVALQNVGPALRDNPNVRAAAPRWSRGDRLPDQYRQNQYAVNDWQQQGLRQPPSNYHWVRDDNNDFFLALVSTGVIAQIVSRQDRDQQWDRHYSREYTYNDDVYYQECRNTPDPAGIILGALIGGLVGNSAGNGRTGPTVAGIIVGGTVGAALTKNMDCQDRSYAYKTYYDGFNSGRPGSRFQWRNPSNGHYGTFRVVSYVNDPYGFRCANYSQQITINGRPQTATGRACRQPDGSWAIVG